MFSSKHEARGSRDDGCGVAIGVVVGRHRVEVDT